jgi:hypothetical protein
MKKGTFWKVTKDTIDIETEELFSCARSRSKTLNPCLCIRKRNIMHLKKRRKVRAKKIQEWVQVSILVIRDFNPTQNIQELIWYLKYERIILTRNSVRTWTENTHITTWRPLGRWRKTLGSHQVDKGKHLAAIK